MRQGVFKYFFVLGFIILLIVTYVIFYNKEDTETEIEDKVSKTTTLITDLRLGIAELDTFNPIYTNNKNVKQISRLIFDSLVTVGENYELQFGLAKGIAKDDDLTYVLSLEENVKFHNGTDFTANDVKYTMDTILNSNSSYRVNLQNVIGTEVVDTYTLKIYLSSPQTFFEYNLTFPILCASYYSGEDAGIPTGTGMFKVTEMVEGMIVLSQNEIYWKTIKPLLTRIEVYLYNNIGEMYNSFKSGYIDIMDVSVNDVSKYIGTLGYNKIDIPTREISFLTFNEANDLFADSRTRKAIAIYLDKNNLIANLGSGYMQTNFIFSGSNWIYDNKLDTVYLNDSLAADILMNEAGWSLQNNRWVRGDGRVLSFTITVDATKMDRLIAARVIAAQLGNHGIEVFVKEDDNVAFENDFNNRNYEALVIGMQTGYSPRLAGLFNEGNIANYYNPEMIELLNTISSTNDYNVQKENYNKLYDIYLNDFPYIFLYRNTDSVIYNQTLCGRISPNDYSMFYNIEKWYRQ